MSSDTAAARIERALDAPALLAAAFDGFEYILLSLRAAEGQASVLLPAFVMSAAAAANGRDAIARASSHSVSRQLAPAAAADPGEIADELAALGLLLATRLTEARITADQAACEDAAAQARRIHELLAAPA